MAVEVYDGADNEMKEESRTEIDSHVNMTVVGRHVYKILDTIWIAEVNPFTPYYEAIQIPIVDAAVVY